jgi:uncharacterized membrane protein YkvA (DUF1232 family)
VAATIGFGMEGKMASQDVSTVITNSTDQAEEQLRDPQKAKQLVENAAQKLHDLEQQQGALADVWMYLQALFRLLQAYTTQRYTEIPWGSIVLTTIALAYFVSPIDLIPDFIPVLGFLDDSAVIAFVVAQIKTDLDNFIAWEAAQTLQSQDADASANLPAS